MYIIMHNYLQTDVFVDCFLLQNFSYVQASNIKCILSHTCMNISCYMCFKVTQHYYMGVYTSCNLICSVALAHRVCLSKDLINR